MRKAIVALLGVGAALSLGFAARRMSRQMRANMSEMAAHCREMMASKNGGGVPSSERAVEERGKTEATAAPTA